MWAWRLGGSGRRLVWLALAVVLLAVVAGPAAQGRVPGLIKLDGWNIKWGPLAYGTGAEVTYMYLRQAHADPAARNCRHMQPLAAMLSRSSLSQERFDQEFKKAAALWSAVANVAFREVAELDAADILIGSQAEPRGIAYANVTMGEGPSRGIAGLARAAICFNPEMPWMVSRDGDPKTFHIRPVIAHELGHAIGLDHLGPEGGIMGFRYVEADDRPLAQLSAADIRAVSRLYGARQLPAVGSFAAAAEVQELPGRDRVSAPTLALDAVASTARLP